jgi:threonine dehydratase
VSAYQYAKNQARVQYAGGEHAFIGVQSEASPFMHAIYLRSSQEGVVEYSSLADGLAGEIEGTSITIPIIKRYTNDLLLVSESEIARAIVYAWQKYQERIEGSAAAALAAALFVDGIPRPMLAIITGGNIDPEVHQSLCREFGVK